MSDFFIVAERQLKNVIEVYPKFKVGRTTDLMIRGGDFYAVWLEEKGVWSTSEFEAQSLIDNELDQYYAKHRERLDACGAKICHLWDAESGMIDRWHKYCQQQMPDVYHELDETLVFANDPVKKTDYASKRLEYPLEAGDISAWDKLVGTLYSESERHKIEWAIGAVVSGDSKKLQKFLVFYGSAGTGKSTILNVIQKLFDGYYAVFDAKALGSSSNMFALEAFKSNPLVAIQHDGDLSKIEDNTRLNSLVSHELMTVNEKYKSTYSNRFNAFLFMGTNKPVKITDARSGLIRRLIDVHPSGNKLSPSEYKTTTSQVAFELGAIAKHCLDLYLEDPDYYDGYIPSEMMGASNDFYNYVIDSYPVFKKEDGITLKAAWEMYKEYCEEARVPYALSKRSFKEELKTYFKKYDERLNLDGSRIRSYYSGFRRERFEEVSVPVEDATPNWLNLNCTESLFDKVFANCLAQYASGENDTPVQPWDKVKTTLANIDTNKTHYMRPPLSLICIDFDLKDKDGNKSAALNLNAAAKFPKTYAELSKGGGGLHLYYYYDGDPTLLSRVYDDEIEIKVFTGKSSIRRRVSKCNDVPIATINSGLPLKEESKKMVNTEVVQTEKGLRTTIKKCLCKEVHANTRCNVDFIKHVLDKAYDSGLTYDVSDMTDAVVHFAANSTNQAAYCLKTVSDMKFKSDDEIESEPVTPTLDSPRVIYDIEVFPNLFLICWKKLGKGNPVVTMINPKPEEVEKLLGFNLIGFNCRKYDNHFLYARAFLHWNNAQLYSLSQGIISGDQNVFFREAYNISYTDIYDFASSGNKKSLKKLEIEMFNKANDPNSNMDDDLRELLKGIHHHELGLHWDEPVPEELWPKVGEYCCDDVLATEAAFYYLSADWTAREILADLADMSPNTKTNTLTTKIIFGGNKNPQHSFCYRDMSKPVHEGDPVYTPEVIEFLREVCPEMMSEPHGPDKSLLPYFPGYEFNFGVSTYRGDTAGEGGYVYSEPGMYGNVALLDVASMHPHSVIAECLFGVKYTKAFRDIVEGRVSIKHEAWDEVNHILDGKLTKHIERVKSGEISSKDLANGLKTAINSVYGLTSARFTNAFKDSRNKDNIVAKRGALFMIDLKNAVQERGFIVAHIKTDSIKIPDATPEIIQFVMDFGKRYGYTFEHEATYDRMCLVNKAVYIAKYKDADACQEMYGYVPGDNKKKGGTWTPTGDQFAVPYVLKKLFTHEPIVMSDLCETFAVAKGALYLDFNEQLPDVSEAEKKLSKLTKEKQKAVSNGFTFEHDDEIQQLTDEIKAGHNFRFIGRVGQFTPVLSGKGGGILYRINEGKLYAAQGSDGYRWLESETAINQSNTNAIDYSFYNTLVDNAIADISEYGDFEWFVSDDPYVDNTPF